ncbi:hypothetical protein [Lignipirellula cremea]|uniref:Lipoprotein n=1 Tax=Lignipirellula cremea TaxID=2528010 RepID=A0A518DP30_9BACT|nr:hypothetical protein [Lignipirellula cremea]QDU93594.1 hypothetical protein Pla8534_13740 [Lignipirellula cremea]
MTRTICLVMMLAIAATGCVQMPWSSWSPQSEPVESADPLEGPPSKWGTRLRPGAPGEAGTGIDGRARDIERNLGYR